MAPMTAEHATTDLRRPPTRAARPGTTGSTHPRSERHGRARELFAVWAARNVDYLALVVGGDADPHGPVSLWRALAVIVVGNLFSISPASWPRAGLHRSTPNEVITRAVFGIGNRVNIVVTSWFISVCYLALNAGRRPPTRHSGWPSGSGVAVTLPVKIGLILAVAGITLAISVYSHATIVRLCLATTRPGPHRGVRRDGGIRPRRADAGYQPGQPLHGSNSGRPRQPDWRSSRSAPLSYTSSADFARYLPTATSPFAVAGWTTLGAYVPASSSPG